MRALFLSLLLMAASAAARDLPDFTALVKERAASVVNVSIAYRVPSWEPPPEPEAGADVEEFLNRFFGPGGARGWQGHSLGSGFVVSADGYIITSAHLVTEGEPREVIVRLADRREYEARVVGADLESDIGLLKIEASGLQAAPLGDPAALEVGEWVAAIGSPFGFERSVTAGIVSGKERTVPQETFIPFIQTDVAVNPGNSGGPLFNLRGEVVAVNALIYSETGGYMGVSFAIPIDFAMEVAAQLKATGTVRRGALPIRIQDVTADLASALRLPRPAGALVSDLQRRGAPSGLQPGDVIVGFEGRPVETTSDLVRFTARTRPGTRVTLEAIRDGQPFSTEALVAERTATEAPPAPDGARKPEPLGLELARGPSGLLVVRSAEHAAARAGLKSGDVILSLNGAEVRSVQAFHERLAQAPGPVVALRVQRGALRMFLALRLG
ncbi:MAG TPA: trypsin-like peptidase domain-containing protein [Burkholderiales bacterium]|nr:trypsin-like peptidase domain-containing protein [Burkholderiales bacterium]